MIDSIIKLLNLSKYKVSSSSYGLFGLKKAQKIEIDEIITTDKLLYIWCELERTFGLPIYVHTFYGRIFKNEGKFISFNIIETSYNCQTYTIFVFDKIPFGKKITYDMYLKINNTLKSVADETELRYDNILLYSKNRLTFSVISKTNVQALIFIQRKSISYYVSKLIFIDSKTTRAISKYNGEEKIERNDINSLRQSIEKVFAYTASIE